MAETLARKQDVQNRQRPERAEVLLSGHVPVSVGGGAPRGAPRGLHGDGHPVPLQAHEGVQRAAPDGVGRVRPARRAVRGRDGDAPGGHDEEERRPLPRTDPRAGLFVRLGPRDQHDGPEVLQVDAVDFRAALQEGAGVRGGGSGQLVSGAGDGPGERGSHRRALRAREPSGGAPSDAAVDAADHGVRGTASEGPGHARLAGGHQGDAAQLDRQVDGGAGRFRHDGRG